MFIRKGFISLYQDTGGNSGIVCPKSYSMNEVKEKYMTVKDYADRYDVTIKTVYNWIEAGRIPKVNVKKVLNVTLIKV